MPLGAGARQHAGDHRRRAGAFDHDVGRELADVVEPRRRDNARRDRARSSGFGPSVAAVEHMDVEPRCTPISAASSPIGPAPVTSSRRGCQEREAPADALDVIPGLGDDAGRLQQHAEHRRAPDRP